MKLTILQGELVRALNLAKPFISRSAKRPILNYVKVAQDPKDNKVYIYATDSYKAVRVLLNVKEIVDFKPFIFNPDMLDKLIKLYNDKAKYDEINFTYNDNVLYVNIKGYEIPLYNNKENKAESYPAIEKTIDSGEYEDLYTVTVDINILMGLLKAFKSSGDTSVSIYINKLGDMSPYKVVSNNLDKDGTKAIICPVRRI